MALPTRVYRGYDPTDVIQREFDGLLNRFFGQRGGQQGNGGSYLAPYAVDVREDNDHIYVEAELPGFKKDEVDVTLEELAERLVMAVVKDELRALFRE